MKKTMTCIICPNGCELETEIENGKVVSVTGNLCPRGKAYALQEVESPKRTIASSVRIKNGTLPLVSVRLNKAVDKDKIFEVMKEINSITLEAPVHVGDVVVKNILGTDSDLIITKNIDKVN